MSHRVQDGDTERVIYLSQLANGYEPESTVGGGQLEYATSRAQTGISHILLDSRIKLLLLIMVLVQALDGIMTQFFVGAGVVSEANPVMAGLVESGSFVWLKIAGCLVFLPALWWLYKRLPRLAYGTVSGVIVFYSAVLSWNAFVLIGSVLT